MSIKGAAGYTQLVAPTAPTSYKGSVDVAVLLAGLAAVISRHLKPEDDKAQKPEGQ